ncbi:MAG TPA: hypothetical protein VIW27_01430, partial [Gammaproteobacteria bacterium]
EGGFLDRGPSVHTAREGSGEKSNAAVEPRSRREGGFLDRGPSVHTAREGPGEKSNAAIAARSR